MDLQEAYLERWQAELDEVDAEIKTFEFKTDNVPSDEQIQFYEDLQALRAQYSKTRQKLGELRESDSQRRSDLKEEFETDWKELQNGMQRARQRTR
jgi:predicted  nucleic acid-binding Zn-ribbon protein